MVDFYWITPTLQQRRCTEAQPENERAKSMGFALDPWKFPILRWGTTQTETSLGEFPKCLKNCINRESTFAFFKVIIRTETEKGSVFGGSLQSDRMATEGNGGLGSSEEVREGQLMDPALERFADGRMVDFMQSLLALLEPQIRRPVREAFEHLMKSGPAMVGGREQIQELDRRNLQLHFQSSLPDSFFTGKIVEGRGDDLIRVKLIDKSTGHVVASGPLSSLKLAVVPLKGDFENKDDDWTQEIFESHVAEQRTGKPPLLTGDLEVSLKEGEGSLGKLKFTDNSISTRSGKFRLGVKVASSLCEGIRVREGITDAFKVKDRRGESYRKHYPPTLDDEVWRLETIRKNGPFHNRLDSKGISKVKDFLQVLGIDAQGLRKILGSSMKDKMWDTLVEHAKTCNLSGKYLVYYADKTKNSGVAFSDSQEGTVDTLKKEAGDKGKDIVEYDGQQLLENNPSKRARFSQTDIVSWAPDSCPSGSSYVGPPVDPWLDNGAPVPCQPPSVPSGETSGNSMSDFEDCMSLFFQDVDSMDLTSLFQQELSEKADGNTSLDALWREVDRSDSHLSGSSLDPPEQAGGNTVRSFRARSGHMTVGGSTLTRTRIRCGRSIPPRRGKVSERKFSIGIKIGKFWDLLRACRRLLGSKVKMEGGKTRSPLSEREEFREMASLDSKFEGLSVA